MESLIGKNKKIQILRGLAILAVVLIHTCNGGMWQVYLRPFLNFAVGMFLFLSGYLTNIDRSDWGSFYKKRLTKVLIPYVVWTILYTVPHFDRLIISLLTARAAVLYYVFVYVQFVLLTPLIGKLAKGRYQWLGWLIAPLSVIAFKYYWLLTGKHLNDYVSIAWNISCLGWFTYYYLGLLLGNGLIRKILPLKAVIVLLIISIPIQMLEGYGWLLLGESNCGTQIKLSTYLTTSLFLVLSYYYLINDKVGPESKLLSFLGDYSFGIYLSHMMVMVVLAHIPFYTSLHIPFPISTVIVLSITCLGLFFTKKLFGEKFCKWMGFV